MKPEIKREKRIRRHKRVRSRIFGTAKRPRLAVFRSNKHIHLQLIDDDSGKTLAYVSTKPSGKSAKPESVESVAKKLAEQASKANIKQVVFDRGGYKYHGKVKQVAESVRAAGLKI